MASVTVNGPESALTAHAIPDCIVATEEPGSMELNEEEEQDTMSKLVIMLMSISWTPAAALRTIVELDIPHILATQVDRSTFKLSTLICMVYRIFYIYGIVDDYFHVLSYLLKWKET
jgi:hypothetical protein